MDDFSSALTLTNTANLYLKITKKAIRLLVIKQSLWLLLPSLNSLQFNTLLITKIINGKHDVKKRNRFNSKGQ
jgi:hypothetical protein